MLQRLTKARPYFIKTACKASLRETHLSLLRNILQLAVFAREKDCKRTMFACCASAMLILIFVAALSLCVSAASISSLESESPPVVAVPGLWRQVQCQTQTCGTGERCLGLKEVCTHDSQRCSRLRRSTIIRQYCIKSPPKAANATAASNTGTPCRTMRCGSCQVVQCISTPTPCIPGPRRHCLQHATLSGCSRIKKGCAPKPPPGPPRDKVQDQCCTTTTYDPHRICRDNFDFAVKFKMNESNDSHYTGRVPVVIFNSSVIRQSLKGVIRLRRRRDSTTGCRCPLLTKGKVWVVAGRADKRGRPALYPNSFAMASNPTIISYLKRPCSPRPRSQRQRRNSDRGTLEHFHRIQGSIGVSSTHARKEVFLTNARLSETSASENAWPAQLLQMEIIDFDGNLIEEP